VIKEFTVGLSTGLPDDLTTGLDGNLWMPQEMDSPTPASVDRVTPAGVITNLSSGLIADGGGDGDTIITGPDGNLWFNDLGMTTKAIARIQLQIPPTAMTGAATAVTTSTATVAGTVNPLGSATTVTVQYGTSPALGSTAAAGSLAASGSPSAITGTLTGLPAGTLIDYRVVATNVGGTTVGATHTFTTTAAVPPPALEVTSATVGNQRITLTTPSPQTCTASTGTLTVTLSSVAIPHSRGVALHFANAAFFLDRGVRHTRTVIKRVHGKRKKVTVVSDTANAVARRVPATVHLRLTGLRSKTHMLKVTLTYRKTQIRKGHKRIVTVTKSLTTRFRVC
jgi:hypothetical protein